MRLDPEIRPEYYHLHLDVDPNREEFAGALELRVCVPDGTRTINLHAVDLKIDELTATDSNGSIDTKLTEKSRQELLRIGFRRGLAGPVVLSFRYRGPLRSDLRGLYLARSGKRRYAATQLEAADARRMFPCFDEPDKKARFAISVSIPKSMRAVSNGAVRKETIRGRRKHVQFTETPPLSTYLIALVIGELATSRARRCGNTPIRVWHVPGKEKLTAFALEAATESLQRLERYFGLPYPYGKLDLIAVPDFEFGAMENAGAVTFRESLLLIDPRAASLRERKRVAEVIAHELAHMWFGDLVTMEWWDDLWLNEAFATWMAYRVIDDWQPDWKMWLDFQQDRAAAFQLDALIHTHPIYTTVSTPDEATENFDAITYEKGAAVVRMLEHWLGASTFKRGVRRYIRRHAEGNARAEHLWNALEEAAGHPVAPVVRRWIEQPGFPLLQVELRERAGRSNLYLKQERYFARPTGYTEERRSRWPIPAVIRVGSTRGRSREVREVLNQHQTRIELGTPKPSTWVYANANEGGFYRPIHSPKLLARLAEKPGRLQPAERMGLLSHQWAGVRANRAALADLLNLIHSLGDEPRPEVLETAISPLAWLSDRTLPLLEETDCVRFRTNIAETFGPAFADCGWRPARGESDAERVRRQVLLRITGELAKDEDVLAKVDEQIVRLLAEPKRVEANLAAPIIDLAAGRGDKTRYTAYLRAMDSARTPQERTRFEFALGAFRDPALVTRTLELLLSDRIPTQDVIPMLGRLFQNPDARELTWTFVQERWPTLEQRISTGLASRLIGALPLLGYAYRSEVAAFFRVHPIPSATRSLKQALETFSLERELKKRTRIELRDWMHTLA